MLIRNGHMMQLNFVFLEESGTFSRHFDQIEINWHSRVIIDIARWARQAIEVAAKPPMQYKSSGSGSIESSSDRNAFHGKGANQLPASASGFTHQLPGGSEPSTAPVSNLPFDSRLYVCCSASKKPIRRNTVVALAVSLDRPSFRPVRTMEEA